MEYSAIHGMNREYRVQGIHTQQKNQIQYESYLIPLTILYARRVKQRLEKDTIYFDGRQDLPFFEMAKTAPRRQRRQRRQDGKDGKTAKTAIK